MLLEGIYFFTVLFPMALVLLI